MYSIFFLAFATVLSVALCDVVSYNYAAFDSSNAATLRVNYDAQISGGDLVLTPGIGSRAGSAFMKNSVTLEGSDGFRASFSTEFSFRIDQNGGDWDNDGMEGGDGLVFVINSRSNGEGCNGGGLGYAGIGNSIGIEFDTFDNFEPIDPNGNHIGIDINGNVESITTAHFSSPLNNGQTYNAWIDYDGEFELLEVRVSSSSIRPILPNIALFINLPAILGSPNCYVGFTASTGRSWERHSILSWWFTNTYSPCSICGNGIVEPGESCDGGVCCTSHCQFASWQTTCHNSSGPCQASAKCNGWSSTCPAGAYYGTSTVCRNATGSCDVAEHCTGISASCPSNSFKASGTVCRNATAPCNEPATCTGYNATCPANPLAPAGTTCQEAAGDCMSTCNGTSTQCPVTNCEAACDPTMTPAQCYCSQQTFDGGALTPNFFCAPGDPEMVYMCDQGPWSDLSMEMPCPPGTYCGCPPGVDCSCGDTMPPCHNGTVPAGCA